MCGSGSKASGLSLAAESRNRFWRMSRDRPERFTAKPGSLRWKQRCVTILTGSQQERQEAPRTDFCPIFPAERAMLAAGWGWGCHSLSPVTQQNRFPSDNQITGEGERK